MHSKTKKNWIVLSIIGIFVIIIPYMFIEPHWLQLKTIDRSSPDIPPAFDGTSIVFLSDIHHGPYVSLVRVKKLVNRVNRLKPDLVLLGGDYVLDNPKYIKPCFAELKNLHTNLGIYGVLGNHDHWEGGNIARENAKNAGIILLDNKAVWVYRGGQRIKIGGVGDLITDSQDLTPTIADVNRHDYVILLSHNPDFVETIKTDRIDLVLSGHTHGGQITLFGLWAPITNSEYGQKYRTGIVKTNYTQVIISNGIGTIFPPLRFFARPQIILIRLHHTT